LANLVQFKRTLMFCLTDWGPLFLPYWILPLDQYWRGRATYVRLPSVIGDIGA